MKLSDISRLLKNILGKNNYGVTTGLPSTLLSHMVWDNRESTMIIWAKCDNRHFRNYGRVHSPIRGTSTFTECYLAGHHRFIDVRNPKYVFLIVSHVTMLSCVSNSSARTANKTFTARSLFTAVKARFWAKRSMPPGTCASQKMPYAGCFSYESIVFLAQMML